MADSFTIVAPLFAPGTHRAFLRSIEKDKSALNSELLAFVFTFVSERGMASRITGLVPRFGNALHRTVCELAGRIVKVGEAVNHSDFIGREYEIDVESKNGHSVQIVAIRPIAAE